MVSKDSKTHPVYCGQMNNKYYVFISYQHFLSVISRLTTNYGKPYNTSCILWAGKYTFRIITVFTKPVYIGYRKKQLEVASFTKCN